MQKENQQLIIDRPFSEFLSRGIVDLKVLIEATLENGSTMPLKHNSFLILTLELILKFLALILQQNLENIFVS